MPRPSRSQAVALRYLGDESGVPHLSGIPSRDLSAAEVRQHAHDLGLKADALVALAVGSGAFTTEAARPAADESPSADGEEHQ
jgi:hypothetical protein